METEIIERCAVCGEEIQPGTEHQDDDGHYYHPECCPGCDAADEGITLWKMIPRGWEDDDKGQASVASTVSVEVSHGCAFR